MTTASVLVLTSLLSAPLCAWGEKPLTLSEIEVATRISAELAGDAAEKNSSEKIENLSDTLPFFEVVIAGIPTALGAWGTHSVLTGKRSPVEWARVLNKVAASDRLSILIRNAFQHLKTHELVALIASGGALMGGMICTTANLVAAIACGMKAYHTKGVERKKWLDNTSVAVARCAGSFVLCGASALCMLLLADYKQSGDTALSHTHWH